MNRIRVHARRLAGLVAGLAGTVLALSAGAPAAFALPQRLPVPGGRGPRANIASKSSVPAGAHTPGGGLPCSPTCQPGVVSRFQGPVQLSPQRPHAAVPGGVHTAVRLPGGVLSRLEGPVQLSPQRPAAAVPAHIHAAVTGGMPGWQITLIAIGAALAAATLAVFLDRAITARRRVSPTAA